MKKLIKKVIKLSEMKHEKKESWLDNIKDAQVVKFCEQNFFLNKKIVGSTLIRHCDQQGVTIAFTLQANTGETLYVFNEYLASKFEASTSDAKFDELAEDWIVLVSESNSGKVIDEETYNEQIVKMLKQVFGNKNKQVNDFIAMVELANDQNLF